MDSLLFGHNTEEKIVAVQQVGDDTMRVYSRSEEGVRHNDVEFYPFIFLSDSSFLKGFPAKYWIKELAGNNYFRYLCAFTCWSEMWDAVHQVIDRYNEGTKQHIESYSELPIIHLRPDAVSQFLIQSGRTLFKRMEFDELYRLQVDIETYSKPGFKYSNANRPEDRIILIALSDNRGWEHILSAQQKSEKELLSDLVRIIHQKDPDVLEGHNIFGFDLPYILKRCELHNVEFGIGRDGSAPRSFDSRSAFAERSFDYVSFDVAGRHIIDTFLLLQAYDVSKRSLESYGLKYAAQHFGFAKADRVYIPGDRISWYWDNDPNLLIRYALDDVQETKQLSELLSPTAFHLSQMVPLNYGTAARVGSAAKIESMILREYVRQKHSVSKPEQGIQTTGGYTDIFYTGTLSRVLHIDVESLYPSIMLTEKIAPGRDQLGVFLSLLGHLTTMRLEAKQKMREAETKVKKSEFDAIQSSFKILINSFYGYLGYSRGLFNDLEAADRVTQSGQKILRQLIGSATKHQCTVIEVDTDGLLFVPPSSVLDEEEEKKLVHRISSVLPANINLRIDGRYKKMLSYKKKNYALLGYDDKIIIKGSSLISRNIEKFGKYFIEQCIHALLNDNIEELHTLYVTLHRDIATHKLTVRDFAKTETLKDNLDQYNQEVQLGQRNRSASYEAALSSGQQWKAGDRISYYIIGNEMSVKGFEHSKLAEEWDPNFPDENSAHYLKRLEEFAKKFELFFTPKDFHSTFSLDDLFPFSSQGITILSAPIEKELAPDHEEPAEAGGADFKIWLEEE